MFIIGLISVVVFVGSILAFFNARRISNLKKELEAIKTYLKIEEKPAAETPPQSEVLQSKKEQESATYHRQPEETQEAAGSKSPVPVLEPVFSDHLKNIHHPSFGKNLFSRADRAIAHYWTGILGVIAVVVGFSFLAILTALRMGHFQRFLMLIGVSVLFFIAARLIQRRNHAELFAAWFQSAAGALVLFACLGSAVIPWLQWVNSEPQGYLLLAAGIIVNLTLALTGSVPWFASFHILISLAALAVAPANAATLTAAVFVTGACSVPALKRSWGLHLLIAETAYFAFVSVWYLNHAFPGEITGILAASSLFAAFIPGLFTPYLSKKDTITPFGISARAASWLYLGVGTLAFTPNSQFVSAVFLLLAASVYFIPRLSKRIPLPWLFRIDGTSALGFALLAAVGLIRLEMDIYLITAIAYLLALLVSLDHRADRLTRNAAVGSQGIIGIILAASAIAGSFGLIFPLTGTLTTIQATIITAVLFMVTAAQIFLFPAGHDKTKAPLPRFITGTLLILLLIGLFVQTISLHILPDWLRFSGAILLPAGGLGLIVHRRRSIPGFTIGLASLIILAHIVSMFSSFETGTAAGTFLPWLTHDILLLSTAVLLVFFSGSKEKLIPAAIGVALMAIDIMAISYDITSNLDKIWLILLWELQGIATYIILRGFSRQLRKDIHRPVEVTGIAVSIIAVIFYAGIFLDGSFTTTPFSLRLITEILGAASLGAWAWQPSTRSREAARIVWSSLAAACASLFLAAEVPDNFIALALALLAVFILFVSSKGPSLLKRLKTLSLIPWTIGLFTTLFYTGGSFFKDFSLFSSQWWLSLAGSTATLGYIAVFYLLKTDTTVSIERFIQKHRNRILFLPWFITIGIFLVFSFDGPALTTFLITESFALFTLGILQKEPLFRPFSYALLAYSLFRLIFIDMAETDTLGRAMIFIISGVLLLGMNWIYSRFGQAKESKRDTENSTGF